MNILELLKVSDKTAFIQGKSRVTYKELLHAGLNFGQNLIKSGIKEKDSVLVFVPLSIELYVVLIGTWSIGAVPIFIDFSQGAKFVDASVERLKPDVVICDRVTGFLRNVYSKIRKIKMLKVQQVTKVIKNSNISPSPKTKIEDLDKQIEVLETRTKDVKSLEPSHPAIMTLTSGSTGVPKVAVRTHGFLINQYYALKAHMDFSSHHIDLGTLPVFALASLASQMTILLPEKSYKGKMDIAKLAKAAKREGVSRAICSPTLLKGMLESEELINLKLAYLGGAPVYPSVLERAQIDMEVHIVYGSTEAEPIAGIGWSEVKEEDRQQIAKGNGLLVGKVVPEVECKIGENGEILVTGKTVLQGYLDGIGDKENKLREGDKVWHRTGDAGYFDDQNRLWLLGRVDQIIHDTKGILYPFCVECILDAHFEIRGAILSHHGKRTVVIEKSKSLRDVSEVLQLLKSQHIEQVITVKKLPMDKRHGAKIDYHRLGKILS